MIPTFTMPLAALTLMLWLLWTDSVRPRRPHPIVDVVRAFLFLAVTGVMIYNVFTRSWTYSAAAKGLVAFASLIGVIGCVFFVRKAMGKSSYRPKKEEEELRLKL